MPNTTMEPFEPFTISMRILIRPCRQDDLPALQWFGLFDSHRGLFEQMFQKHLSGQAIILVVEADGETSGQAWIDLHRRDVDGTGVLWAVRILPCLQNKGIGTRLVFAAEQILRQRGFHCCELSVEKDSPRPMRLYQRLGYRLIEPEPTDLPASQWILRKDLRRRAGSTEIPRVEAAIGGQG